LTIDSFFADFDLNALFDPASPIAAQVSNSQEVPMGSTNETVSTPADTHDKYDQDICSTNEKQEVVIKSTVKQF